MSTTLSNGYIRPDTGDRGSTFFPDLESNITRLNGHTHDGTDGEKINTKNIVKGTNTLLSAGWGVDLGGGTYKQTVTMPSGVTFDTSIIYARDTTNDDVIYPTITKVSSNTYDLFVNDNTIDVEAVYG